MNMAGRGRGILVVLCWVLAVLWMLVAAGLPWAPTAVLSKRLALVTGGAGALMCLLNRVRHQWRQRPVNRRPVRALILIAIGLPITIAIGLLSIFIAYGEFSVGGEELRQSFDDREHSRKLFIYVRSVVPDGDQSSRIAVQRGIWPFERTVLNVNRVFLDFGRRDTKGLLLQFTGSVTARYRFDDGTVELQ